FLRGAQIAPRKIAVLRFGVNNPGLDVIDLGVKAIAAMNQRPILVGDAIASKRCAGTTPTAVVLQTTANVIGLFVVQADFVKLADGDVIQKVPGLAVVVAPVNAAVAARDNVIRIERIDPQRVEISVDFLRASRGESF